MIGRVVSLKNTDLKCAKFRDNKMDIVVKIMIACSKKKHSSVNQTLIGTDFKASTTVSVPPVLTASHINDSFPTRQLQHVYDLIMYTAV